MVLDLLPWERAQTRTPGKIKNQTQKSKSIEADPNV